MPFPMYRNKTRTHRPHIHIEDRVQQALAQYLNCGHPKVLWTASCGGMITTKTTASRMKRMGYRRGCPDMMIFEPRGKYHGLFIELKTETGKASPHQKAFIHDLQQRGYKAEIAYGFDQAYYLIEGYLNGKYSK